MAPSTESRREKAIRVLTSLHNDFAIQIINEIRRKKKWKASEKLTSIKHCVDIAEAIETALNKLKEDL